MPRGPAIRHIIQDGTEGKVCSKCQRWAPLADYAKRARAHDGLNYRCKECERRYALEHQEERRTYDAARKERRHALHVERTYGLPGGEYGRLLTAQGGVCAICGGSALREGHSLSVDHDHETNGVRGLLCSNCNQGLGLLGDSPQRLRAAADYLEKSRGEAPSPAT